ncbi:formylglycine-generating enzyme family protein [Gracilimonas sp. Q87]|uniref:formylglycine-generating enzyme family protein n=1 Tax=Gracilimonas sp. Q87 TaxID=3384766 RepID=UPI00398444B8
MAFQQYDEFSLSIDRAFPNLKGFGRGKRAIVYINWHEANTFCNYCRWRLPTETEWEYAARSAGKPTRYAGTSDPDLLDQFAITVNSNIEFSYLVGSRKPNDLACKIWVAMYLRWSVHFIRIIPTLISDMN